MEGEEGTLHLFEYQVTKLTHVSKFLNTEFLNTDYITVLDMFYLLNKGACVHAEY